MNKDAEWYTPPLFIEAAREVMGSIELDVASCSFANTIVRAERYFTKEQDALKQSWVAKTVWCNPPYGRDSHYGSSIGAFTRKAHEGYLAGQIGQAILLTTTEMNANWFYPLAVYPHCVPRKRVNFIVLKQIKRGIYSHSYGTCFIYLGPSIERFAQVFGKFGYVYHYIARPEPEQYSPGTWIEEVKILRKK